jgi:hypothetical protein
MEIVETPNTEHLEVFKQNVKLWIELDNQCKKLSQLAREKKTVQRALTERILTFMTRYNIEDLNTKDGKLRYKVMRVKPTIKQKTIKQKLNEYFSDNPELGEKVMKTVFEEPTPVEKHQLRRLKNVTVNVVNV